MARGGASPWGNARGKPDSARRGSLSGSKERLMIDLTGKPAVPFALRDGTGRIHRPETYRGSWLLMVFHRHLG